MEQSIQVTDSGTKAPAFQFYPKDFLTDENVRVMSLQERGAYITLICLCWTEGSLPADTERLARLCGVPATFFRKLWPALAVCFREAESGRLVHPRLEREKDKQAHYRRRQSDNAAKRWSRSVPTAASTSHSSPRSQRLADARARGTHTEAEWLALVDEFGSCVKCGAHDVHLVKDHVVPIYQGGSDGIGNIQPFCMRCNASKGPDTTDYRVRRRSQAPAERLPRHGETPALLSSSSSVDLKSSSEPTNTAPEPVEASPSLLTFPTIGAHGAQWHLRETQAAEWRSLFPAVDVLGEARKALAWLQANPTKRKTAKGMPRFLVAWLTRCVDRGGNSGAAVPVGRRVQTREETDVYLAELRRDRDAARAEGGSWKFTDVANG